MIKVQAVPIYSDNYVWFIIHKNACFVVDPGDAKPIIAFIKAQNLVLKGILITHGHWDHVTGIDELLVYASVPVWGPKRLDHPSLTHPLEQDDLLTLQLEDIQLQAHILDTPGHRFDHICYHFAEHAWLFCGDVLFSAGCGRVGGEMRDAYHSLQKLAELPGKTLVFCTHEYTLDNLRFAITAEPNNDALKAYQTQVKQMRQLGKPSLPTTIEQEHAINPFLRLDSPEIAQSIQSVMKKTPSTDFDTFEQLRLWKNRF